MYAEVTYCYRPSSVVCPYVRIVSPVKTAEPTEISFWKWTWVGPRNHVLDRHPDILMLRANFEGEGKERPT